MGGLTPCALSDMGIEGTGLLSMLMAYWYVCVYIGKGLRKWSDGCSLEKGKSKADVGAGEGLRFLACAHIKGRSNA
jgi:hypothetical protein